MHQSTERHDCSHNFTIYYNNDFSGFQPCSLNHTEVEQIFETLNFVVAVKLFEKFEKFENFSQNRQTICHFFYRHLNRFYGSA